MRDRAHTHPCAHCQTPVDCDGQQRQSFDGWPPVVCDLYHLEGGVTARVLCEACEEQVKAPTARDVAENL